MPDDLYMHLILDNYRAHKFEEVKYWFPRHPRYTCHHIPTGSSWLNQFEHFFTALTMHPLRRGTHPSVQTMERTNWVYLDNHNQDPMLFKWTISADGIMASVDRIVKSTNLAGRQYIHIRKDNSQEAH